NFNKDSLGWSISQFQLWARGYFTVPESSSEHKIPILIQCHNIGDFYINDQRFHGDWYNYRTSYYILYLTTNTQYTINVRIINKIDVVNCPIKVFIKNYILFYFFLINNIFILCIKNFLLDNS